MNKDLLFSPYSVGTTELRNRVVMAPMTRCRADNADLAPTGMFSEYYAQRASAGLIVSEGTVVSDQARGYAYTPGLYNAAQVTGWQRVTKAVHARSGRIFAQLWHCGRISHHSLRRDGSPPVGPGNEPAKSETFGMGNDGKAATMSCDVPRALGSAEVKAIVRDFANCARNALEAGFDGVEIHAANGYLFDQFRCAYLNVRADEYGGSLQNRWRFLIETVEAVAAATGAQRVGVRIAPLGTFNDMRPDPDPMRTYGHIARELQRLGIAYLHVFDQSGTWIHESDNALVKHLRRSYSGALMLCGGFDRIKADAALAAGSADLVAFGKDYTSNPDLAERLRSGAPLAPWNAKTFYTAGAEGYTDFPSMAAKERP